MANVSQKPTQKPLQEQKLSLVGKMFLAGASAWLVGKKTNIKLRGSQREIEALVQVLKATREFQAELVRPGATVNSVMKKLGLKHVAARDFERVYGIPFPG